MTTTPSTLDQKALRTAIQEEYEAVASEPRAWFSLPYRPSISRAPGIRRGMA